MPTQTFTFLYPSQSAQKIELLAICQIFQMFPNQPFNLFSDSKYIVNALNIIEIVPKISSASTIHSSLSTIQKLIWDHKEPFFVGHIRAHTGLPGPLSIGNALADLATRDIHIFSMFLEAENFHKKFPY